MWHTNSSDSMVLGSNHHLFFDTVDVSTVDRSLRDIIQSLQHQGYLEASIDQIDSAEDLLKIELHIGPLYTWSYLDISTVPDLIRKIPRIQNLEGKPVDFREIAVLFDLILETAENSGYPFATVKLDDVEIEQSDIKARINVNLKNPVKIESVEVEGDLRLSERYLSHFLGIDKGDVFEKDKIVDAPNQLGSLPFLTMYQSPEVDFLGNSARVHLYLDRKNANQFDILLGLLPSPNPERRFQLTGNVNVDMYNQFAAGERLHLNFENLQPGVQELEIDVNYPFIFNLPFGLDSHFDLYKRDSTYIDLGYHLGLQYLISGYNYLSFFTERDGTNLLNVDTSQIINSRKLPQNIDVRRNLFGLEYHHEYLDYRPNPRKGHNLTLRTSIGTKRINKNSNIIGLKDPSDENFDFNSLYEELDLKSFQLRAQSTFNLFIPLFESSTVLLSNKTGWVTSGEDLFQNELYRIGGTKTLRGFNEEVIFTNFYNIATIEYRLLIDRNSNIFTFLDFGYYDQHSTSSRISDNPMGIGVGLNLSTKIGIFSISYALGTDKNESLNFRNGRIHFGMVTQF